MIQNLSKHSAKYKKSNHNLKIAIIRSNYYQKLTRSLEKACRDSLIASGIKNKNITSFEVPGSWEIPLAAKKAALSKKFDGIVVFGIIIKGETYHFELIANSCARTLMDISLEFNIPITFEILATYNLEQAEKRSIGKHNKGIEAAKAFLEAVKTHEKI